MAAVVEERIEPAELALVSAAVHTGLVPAVVVEHIAAAGPVRTERSVEWMVPVVPACKLDRDSLACCCTRPSHEQINGQTLTDITECSVLAYNNI